MMETDRIFTSHDALAWCRRTIHMADNIGENDIVDAAVNALPHLETIHRLLCLHDDCYDRN